MIDIHNLALDSDDDPRDGRIDSVPIWLLKVIAERGCLGHAALTYQQMAYVERRLDRAIELGIVRFNPNPQCWGLTKRGYVVLDIMNLPRADRAAALLVLGITPREFA